MEVGQDRQVKVTLVFTRPDALPAVTVDASSGESAFVDAVKDHVRSWRVPCLPAGGEARLIQEDVFSKDTRRVSYGDIEDMADTLRRQRAACLQTAGKGAIPRDPVAAMRRGIQGRVVAMLRFFGPDQPPSVQSRSRPSAKALLEPIRNRVEGLRIPCLQPLEEVTVSRTFVFRFEDDSAYGFKPLTLWQVLANAKDIKQQTLVFDTTEMSCPFDVSFRYRQPYFANSVGSLGSANSARRPLLDVLKGVEFDLRPEALDSIYGDETTVTVRCTKIDLKPQT